MNVEDRVRRYIVEELNFTGPAHTLTDDLPLLEEGIVDSMGIFNIVGLLENSFGITVADEDLVPENFATIGSIARFVESRRAGTA